ncbi:hypothetical protein ACJ73_09232 [Blastomyces percursus]|uniref:Uncharacterized protein n=1 Tax=Blastomyces percursus TaxID=1658174 RepID=A0A1J9QAJ4_9EURO|nr:hypothetical protein ACJ73_09232 [Blastomyces percursus]
MTAKTAYHTKALYDTTRFASRVEVEPLAHFFYEEWGNRPHTVTDREIVRGLIVHEVVASQDPVKMFTVATFYIAALSSRAESIGFREPIRALLWRIGSDFVICAKDIRV